MAKLELLPELAEVARQMADLQSRSLAEPQTVHFHTKPVAM